MAMLTMSEYLENVELHWNENTVEIRWTFEDRPYALAMAAGMYELLEIPDGLPAPILLKLARPVTVGGDKMNVEVQL